MSSFIGHQRSHEAITQPAHPMRSSWVSIQYLFTSKLGDTSCELLLDNQT